MELLIRVVDKLPRSADRDTDNGRTKRGDVIAICPDGHPWGIEERTNPEWRLVRSVDLLDNDRGNWLSPEVLQAGVTYRPRKRGWYIDIDSMSAVNRNRFAAARATNGNPDVTMLRAVLFAAATLKPPLT